MEISLFSCVVVAAGPMCFGKILTPHTFFTSIKIKLSARGSEPQLAVRSGNATLFCGNMDIAFPPEPHLPEVE